MERTGTGKGMKMECEVDIRTEETGVDEVYNTELFPLNPFIPFDSETYFFDTVIT